MPSKKERPSRGRERGVPVPTKAEVLGALADMLDAMSIREVVAFVDHVKRYTRRGRKSRG